ncbi:MAG: phage holin family protein [Candidatus Roizmanbacteria bacterium]
MGIIVKLLVNTIAVIVASYLLQGMVRVDSFMSALIVAVSLGVVNMIIKPIISVITFPLTILTLGLFTFVINALMVLLVDWLVPGFQVRDFWVAMAFSLVLSVVSWFLNSLTKKD